MYIWVLDISYSGPLGDELEYRYCSTREIARTLYKDLKKQYKQYNPNIHCHKELLITT